MSNGSEGLPLDDGAQGVKTSALGVVTVNP